MESDLKLKSSLAVHGTGWEVLPDLSGHGRFSLLGVLAALLLALVFIALTNRTAQAWPSKIVANGKSCMAAGCHSTSAGTIETAVKNVRSTSVTVVPGETFEVDWRYTAQATSGNPDSAMMIAVPTGWTVANGTANSPTGFTSWSSIWDNAAGVGTYTFASTSLADLPATPDGYAIDFTGTLWFHANGTAADYGQTGSAAPVDRDGTPNLMGADARITVPSGTSPGTYSIVVMGAGHNGSKKSNIAQTITVTVQTAAKQTPTVYSWPTASAITYGQALSASSLSGGSTSVPGTFDWITASTTPAVGALPQGVRFTPADTTNYNNVEGTVAITVNKKALTATASSPGKTYGAAVPALTISYSGFVLGESSEVLDTPPIASTSAASSSTVGTYATVVSGGIDNNYSFTYVDGTLTVNPAPLTVTAAAKSKTYGAADPALTYTATGFVLGETSAVMTGSLTRLAGENAGTYSIDQGTVSAPNYAISYTGANLTIDPAPLAITADVQGKVYGSADPTLTYTASGLIGSDTTSGSLARVAGENVGSYAINQGTVSAGGNYSIAYTGASLSITAKPMTITADAQSKVYGSSDPALTYTTSGLVGGETLSGSLARVAGENVGSYAINQGTVSAGSNYSASYTGADLSITPAPLTITADAKSKVYGAADPALTFVATGLVGSDTISGSLARAIGENVGNYAITQGSLSAGSNYAPTYTSANLSIAPAPLTVRADNKTRAVGQPDPAFTAIYSGFVNGETAALVSGAPTFSTTATEASPAGDYPITPALGTLAAPNYEFTTFVNGTLTITAAAGPYRLTVSVAGSGSGSVHSNDGNISCTGTTGCSYDYPDGTPVTLTVTTSSGSVFAGWSGACTGNGDCNVTMDAAKDVTATFNPMPLARIGETYYPTFWDAYAAIDPIVNGVIQVRDIAMPGGTFTKLGIIFDGGYDALWNKTSVTPVNGAIIIDQGTLTVDGMSIQ